MVKVPTQSSSVTEPSVRKASGPLHLLPLCPERSSAFYLRASLPPCLQVSAPTSPRQRPFLSTLYKQSSVRPRILLHSLCGTSHDPPKLYNPSAELHVMRGSILLPRALKDPQKGAHWVLNTYLLTEQTNSGGAERGSPESGCPVPPRPVEPGGVGEGSFSLGHPACRQGGRARKELTDGRA